jgi:hypothetical protein
MPEARTDSAARTRTNSRGSRDARAARALHEAASMSLLRLVLASSLSCLLSAAACAEAPAAASSPDAAVPLDPAGTYDLTSALSLSAAPAAAADALAELTAMTDGPDDPSRYLIDRMIEKLPDGSTKTYATAVAPYLAAYVNQRIAAVAPRFADGARALSAGLVRVAQRFGTTETFAIGGKRESGIDAPGDARALVRTIVGLRFDRLAGGDSADVRFAPLGLPDIAVTSRVVLERDQLAIDRHAIALPYRRLLRLGFDFAVVPEVVPGAHDLGTALAALVDCDQLGAAVAEWLEIGSASFYASACSVGLTAIASRLYARIDAIDVSSLALEATGVAQAVDADGDGTMDAIAAGAWTGHFPDGTVAGNFAGAAR